MKRLTLIVALVGASTLAQVPMQLPTPMIMNWDSHGLMSRQISANLVRQNLANQFVNRSAASDRTEESSSGDALSSTAAEQSVDLDFTPSMQRRRANYASFVERSRRVDPAGAEHLAATLRNDPVGLMAPELAKFGLRVDNVADAYAVYWVEAWQAVHGVSGASSPQTAQAVRQQAANAINATPAFASATSAQKQELAESFLVQALLVGAAKEQAQGDRAKMAQLSAAVDKGARAAGLNLRSMTLTEAGFGPARKTGAADPAPGAEPGALAATGKADSRPSYGFLAAAGGAGLGAAFLIGKAMGRKG